MKNKNSKLLVVGDRVLIIPDKGEDKTKVGLYLPQSVVNKESVQSGRIVETGPGTPLPTPNDMNDEPWKSNASNLQYVPMQAEVGDHAIFLRKAAIEIQYDGTDYLVVPQAAILVIVREDLDTPSELTL